MEADWFDRIEQTHAATVRALQAAFPENGNSGKALRWMPETDAYICHAIHTTAKFLSEL